MTAAGQLGPVARLLPTTTATTLRKTKHEHIVLDGPFAETKEQLLGFYVVAPGEREARLEAVMAMVYLVFNEGYSTSTGSHTEAGRERAGLRDEAIRLSRLLVKLFPEPEVMGLAALPADGARSRERIAPLVRPRDLPREHACRGQPHPAPARPTRGRSSARGGILNHLGAGPSARSPQRRRSRRSA